MYPRLIADGRPFAPDMLEREAHRIGAGVAALGLAEGSTVAAMLRNSFEHVALILACRLAGIYLVEINWHFKACEASHLIVDSGAQALFVQQDLLPQVLGGLPAGLHRIIVHATSPLTPDSIDWCEFALDSPAMPARCGLTHGTVAYTSGTTGKPKGVRRLPRSNGTGLDADQQSVNRIVFGATRESVVLLSAPLYHSAPMSYLIHACLVGATLILESSFDARRTLSLIDKHRVSHTYLVPTMYQRLLRLDETERSAVDLSSIVQVTSTGSPCPADLKRRMIEWWGPVITEAYASSETGYITFIDSADWLAHPESAGRAVGQARIRILDDAGAPVPTGQIGSIYARQPATPDFTYINNHAARQALERDGLFTLGDLGYLDGDGYLTICDRKSDMVISGGANIYPAEIEAVLQTMPGVADCAVFGIPDPEFGESLVAAVQMLPGKSAEVESVRTFLRERIAHFKVPRQVTFHDALPREDTGKIFKRLLREPYWRDQTRSI